MIKKLLLLVVFAAVIYVGMNWRDDAMALKEDVSSIKEDAASRLDDAKKKVENTILD